MSGGEGGGAWEVANVPCLGERGEGPGKWLILYQVWGEGLGKWLITMSGGEGGGAWEVVNIVPCLGERGEGPGKWLMYHVQGRGGRGLGSG